MNIFDALKRMYNEGLHVKSISEFSHEYAWSNTPGYINSVSHGVDVHLDVFILNNLKTKFTLAPEEKPKCDICKGSGVYYLKDDLGFEGYKCDCQPKEE